MSASGNLQTWWVGSVEIANCRGRPSLAYPYRQSLEANRGDDHLIFSRDLGGGSGANRCQLSFQVKRSKHKLSSEIPAHCDCREYSFKVWGMIPTSEFHEFVPSTKQPKPPKPPNFTSVLCAVVLKMAAQAQGRVEADRGLQGITAPQPY